MVNEVRKNQRLHRTIAGIPWTDDAAKMVVYHVREDGEEEPRVKALTTLVRAMVYTFVILPKVGVSILLLLIGTMWLAATDSFADLVLNAIALEFVIHIDELLFEAMLPASIVSSIEGTKIWKRAPKKTNQQKDAEIRAGYERTAGYFFGTLVGVFVYMTFAQKLPLVGVIPGYANDAFCPIFWHDKTQFVCSVGEECFPFGGAKASGALGDGGKASKEYRKKHPAHGHKR